MSHRSQALLLALQTFHVAFLWLHDWVPLGRLNDVAAIRQQDSTGHLVAVTLMQATPFTAGWLASLWYFGQTCPDWLHSWLWISYIALFVGEFRAWWLPYLLVPDEIRAKRYRAMFGNTHTLLPQRNGMVPNTLHTLLHAATLATLIVLFAAP